MPSFALRRTMRQMKYNGPMKNLHKLCQIRAMCPRKSLLALLSARATFEDSSQFPSNSQFYVDKPATIEWPILARSPTCDRYATHTLVENLVVGCCQVTTLYGAWKIITVALSARGNCNFGPSAHFAIWVLREMREHIVLPGSTLDRGSGIVGSRGLTIQELKLLHRPHGQRMPPTFLANHANASPSAQLSSSLSKVISTSTRATLRSCFAAFPLVSAQTALTLSPVTKEWVATVLHWNSMIRPTRLGQFQEKNSTLHDVFLPFFR